MGQVGRAARAEGDAWLAELAVANPDDPVWVIANATYPSGHRLSSRPVFAVPAKLGPVAARPLSRRVVYDPNTDSATEPEWRSGSFAMNASALCQVAGVAPPFPLSVTGGGNVVSRAEETAWPPGTLQAHPSDAIVFPWPGANSYLSGVPRQGRVATSVDEPIAC